MGKLYIPTREEDAAISKAIAEDTDTWEMTEEEFKTARRGRPPMLPKDRKQSVHIMLDRHVVEHYKAGGKGWQTRINDDLANKVRGEQKKAAL